MVQYYHIFDIAALPYDRAAVLVSGLPNDSRVKMAMNGMKVPLDTYLLASVVDRLSIIAWQNTQDAKHHRNKPDSIVAHLTGRGQANGKRAVRKFRSGAAFEAAFKSLTSGKGG